MGLILSTPLTVCLLVLGRNLPQLRFLETMLGSTPALGVPARIYQRLIANDADEAVEIASTEIEKSSVVSFYDTVGIDSFVWQAKNFSRTQAPSTACVWRAEWMRCSTISGINTQPP